MTQYLSDTEDLWERNYEEETLDNLTDYIVSKYHGYLWIELPKLITLFAMIVDERSPDHADLRKVKKLVVMLKKEIEENLEREEKDQ